MLRFTACCTALSIIACSLKPNEASEVFFGGEIVNPTSKYVTLYKGDTPIDSAELDDEQHFSFMLKDIAEGLYHFEHSPELQYIYLREGDSIVIRLNTMTFDESLVFSGIGSRINTFLIDTFMATERETPWIEQYYSYTPNAFRKQIDSMRTEKITALQELLPTELSSKKAITLAKATIDYTTFTYKERYPFYHKKQRGEGIKGAIDIPNEFYEHRATVDLNNKEMAYFRPYFGFVKAYFNNLSYAATKEQYNKQGKLPNSLLYFSTYRLNLVDSLIQEEALRNLLLRNTAMNYILKKHKSSKGSQAFIDKFKALSTHKTHKEEIDHLYQGIKNLQPGKSLPNLVLTDMDNKPVSLKQISKHGTTVFYFWTAEKESYFREVFQHLEELKKKYRDYKFVGINFNTNYPRWVKVVKSYGLDKAKQLHAEDFKELQAAMILNDIDKCVIAKDTLIVDGFSHLYNSFL